MKKLSFCFSLGLVLLLTGCSHIFEEPKMTINESDARTKYTDKITISPMDGTVKIEKNKVIISPSQENQTYIISGYFNGQIVSSTKNTIIKLNNAFLENTSGKAALKCSAKTEVSAVNGTENYIVSSGRGYSNNAALQGKRDIVIGGSGKLFVKGMICHGLEAEDVKIKGSGEFYFQGTRKGSALNSESFSVEPDKSFSAYFLNSKNGIKGDNTIKIASGNFHFYNNGVAMKTDTRSETEKNIHFIKLSGGEFHTYKNDLLYVTESGEYSASGVSLLEE